MKLSDLSPLFMKYDVNENGVKVHTPVMTLGEAQGITFLCPKCMEDNAAKLPADRVYGIDVLESMSIGVHSVNVTFADKGVPDELGSSSEGQPTRWNIAAGNDFTDLSLTPSIWLKYSCGWHGYITDGEATLI